MAGKRNSQFKRGSGVYTCESCGKRTRATGQSEEYCGLCAACYDEAGWENEHQDGGHEPGSMPEHCPLCREGATPTEAACPHCNAKPGERCVGPNGTPWTGGHVHKARKAAPSAPAAPALRLATVGKAQTVHVANGEATLCNRPVEARALDRAFKRADLRNGMVSCKACRKALQ